MRPRAALGAALVSAASIAACASDPGVVHETAADRGRALFASPRASESVSNPFACATCHPTVAVTPGRIWAGAPLLGVTARRSFWGGHELDLLASINDCRARFMDAPRPWTTESEDARSMWAYLQTLEGGQEPAPFTVVAPPTELGGGDAERGATTFAAACAPCHGARSTGEGRLASFVPALPDAFAAAHATLPAPEVRAIAAAKIRRGGIATPGESMPPFSREQLSDAQLLDLIAWLGL